MKFCRNFADNLENVDILSFSEIFEFSRQNSYFERIRTVRMVRMVRSLADRTFQLCAAPTSAGLLREVAPAPRGGVVLRTPAIRAPGLRVGAG